MKSRTNNKIVFCQNCIEALTPDQKIFCNEYCWRAKKDLEEARAEKNQEAGTTPKTIWIYLNKNFLDLAKSQQVFSIRFSHFFWGDTNWWEWPSLTWRNWKPSATTKPTCTTPGGAKLAA